MGVANPKDKFAPIPTNLNSLKRALAPACGRCETIPRALPDSRPCTPLHTLAHLHTLTHPYTPAHPSPKFET